MRTGRPSQLAESRGDSSLPQGSASSQRTPASTPSPLPGLQSSWANSERVRSRRSFTAVPKLEASVTASSRHSPPTVRWCFPRRWWSASLAPSESEYVSPLTKPDASSGSRNCRLRSTLERVTSSVPACHGLQRNGRATRFSSAPVKRLGVSCAPENGISVCPVVRRTRTPMRACRAEVDAKVDQPGARPEGVVRQRSVPRAVDRAHVGIPRGPGEAGLDLPAAPPVAATLDQGVQPVPANAAGHELHHAPDRVAAVESGERAAHDLDAVETRGERETPVVPAEERGVEPHPVEHHQRVGRGGAAHEERGDAAVQPGTEYGHAWHPSQGVGDRRHALGLHAARPGSPSRRRAPRPLASPRPWR